MHSPLRAPLVFSRLEPERMQAEARHFFERMKGRRTVRHFSPEPVPRSIVEDCLRAAGTAPSGANLQPWHFVAVSDSGLKQQIRAAAEEEERAFYGGRATPAWLKTLAPLETDASKPFLELAPWLIVIFSVHSHVNAEGQKEPTYYPKESVGIATGLLIAALHQAGLATLTHTPSPMHFLHTLLGRPAEEKAFLILVVGYPTADATVPALTRKALAEIATFL